jgi:1,2-diacylglycerol 3-alpha-glucosyltransferase
MLREFHVLAQNEEVAAEMTQMGVKDVRLMPFALDLDDLPEKPYSAREQARRALELPPGPVLGFVGRVSPYKEPLQLPEVLLDLRRRQPWSLAMVGEGPLSEDLDVALERSELKPHVRWSKRVPNCEMWKLYCAADVLVNLNRTEIVGLCILESLYYGTPVVAVDAPGPRLMIRDGIDGYVCGYATEEIADKIVEARERILPNFDAQESSGRFSWTISGAVANQLLSELA